MQDATPITEDMGGFEDIDGGRDSEGFSSFASNADPFLKNQPLSHFKEGMEGG